MRRHPPAHPRGAAAIPALVPVLALLLAGQASPVRAGVCTVPGTHPSIQDAVDDPSCATIDLSAQTYPESVNIPRSLTLAGPGGGGAIVEGLVQVVGAGTAVDLQNLEIRNGCPENALLVLQGAEVDGIRLTVERSGGLPCPVLSIFADGFESGDTSAWSSQVP